MVDFSCSPLFEAALSLRVVAEPRRAPLHLPWVRRCRELPEPLQAEIRALFRPFHGTFVPGIFEVALAGDHATFADELGALSGLADSLVAFELSLAYGGIGCHTELQAPAGEVVDDADYRDRVPRAAPDDAMRALAGQAFDDPRALLERDARLLEDYGDATFRDEWQRTAPSATRPACRSPGSWRRTPAPPRSWPSR